VNIVDLNELAKQKAQQILNTQGIDVNCPNCHQQFTAHSNPANCPHCGGTFTVHFNIR
jgi:Zn finger protein HypA/HybF involved in hydrogenase expression